MIGIDDRLVDTFEFENAFEHVDSLLVAGRGIILHRQILAVDVQGLRDLDDRCVQEKTLTGKDSSYLILVVFNGIEQIIELDLALASIDDHRGTK